nr:hypothetical protein Q903MT_gene259 [Picea sitchensis]
MSDFVPLHSTIYHPRPLLLHLEWQGTLHLIFLHLPNPLRFRPCSREICMKTKLLYKRSSCSRMT